MGLPIPDIFHRRPRYTLDWPEDQSFNDVLNDWRIILDSNRKHRRHPFNVFFVAKADGMEELLGNILHSLGIAQNCVVADEVNRPKTVDFILRTLQRKNDIKKLKGDTIAYVINKYQRALQGMDTKYRINAAHNWTQGFLETSELRQDFVGRNIGVFTCIDGTLGNQAYQNAIDAVVNVQTKSGLLIVK